MNKLCCKVNPIFLCKACGMTVCDSCYNEGAGELFTRTEKSKSFVYFVEWHEENQQCPEGANYWLNEHDNDASTVIFAIK